MDTQRIFGTSILLLSLIVLISPVIAAENNAPNNNSRAGHQGPPQEAIDACDASKSGQSYSCKSRRGEQLAGSCFAPSGGNLACRPADFEERRMKHQANKQGNGPRATD